MEASTGAVPESLSAAERLAGYMRQKLVRFESSLEDACASGEVEAIHGLRVASRRLTEPLEVLAGWADRREIKSLRKGLQRTRRAFRKVRDLDVLNHSLISGAGGSLSEEDRGELDSLIAAQRGRALAVSHRRCRKLKPRRIHEQLDDLCSALDTEISQDAAIRDRLDQRMQALAHELRECDPRQETGPDLHVARIQVKRLRYCAELAGDVTGRPNAPLVEALTHMQNLLGHWNDQVTAARWLGRLAGRRSALARRTAWSARLFAQAAERARLAEAQREDILAEWSALDPFLEGDAGDETPVVREDLQHV